MSFPRSFYAANTLEIFERLAWYGFFTVSSLYMTSPQHQGGLGFSEGERGFLQGFIPFLLYLFPVVTGALADRYGYKHMFWIAFVILCPGYYLLGQAQDFWSFFAAFLAVAIGAACFKPVVVGTVSRCTHAGNRGLGFGIFYTMVNLGGFIGPFVAGYLRAISWDWVFIASAGWIAINMVILALFFTEPGSQEKSDNRGLSQVMAECQQVLGNARLAFWLLPLVIALMLWGKGTLSGTQFIGITLPWCLLNLVWDYRVKKIDGLRWYLQPTRVGDQRFVLYLLILAGFWTVYNQLFFTLPLYIRDYVDTTDLVRALHALHPALVDFLAPVNTNQLAQHLTLASSQPFSQWYAQLASYKVLVPAPIAEAIYVQLSEHAADAALIAQQWRDQFRQVNPEYIINLDFGAIILFQVLVSRMAARFDAIAVISSGLLLIAFACFMGGWLHGGVMGGFAICAVVIAWAGGEMLASPKSQEYVAALSPSNQSALYMGYYFVSMAIGMLFAGLLSGWSYQWFARELNKPEWMWILFGALGLLSATALIVYRKPALSRWLFPTITPNGSTSR